MKQELTVRSSEFFGALNKIKTMVYEGKFNKTISPTVTIKAHPAKGVQVEARRDRSFLAYDVPGAEVSSEDGFEIILNLKKLLETELEDKSFMLTIENFEGYATISYGPDMKLSFPKCSQAEVDNRSDNLGDTVCPKSARLELNVSKLIQSNFKDLIKFMVSDSAHSLSNAVITTENESSEVFILKGSNGKSTISFTIMEQELETATPLKRESPFLIPYAVVKFINTLKVPRKGMGPQVIISNEIYMDSHKIMVVYENFVYEYIVKNFINNIPEQEEPTDIVEDPACIMIKCYGKEFGQELSKLVYKSKSDRLIKISAERGKIELQNQSDILDAVKCDMDKKIETVYTAMFDGTRQTFELDALESLAGAFTDDMAEITIYGGAMPIMASSNEGYKKVQVWPI